MSLSNLEFLLMSFYTVGTTDLIGISFPDQETVAQSGNLYHVM